jgi:hypothetical protein
MNPCPSCGDLVGFDNERCPSCGASRRTGDDAVWTPPRTLTAKIVSWALLLLIAAVLIGGLLMAIRGTTPPLQHP